MFLFKELKGHGDEFSYPFSFSEIKLFSLEIAFFLIVFWQEALDLTILFITTMFIKVSLFQGSKCYSVMRIFIFIGSYSRFKLFQFFLEDIEFILSLIEGSLSFQSEFVLPPFDFIDSEYPWNRRYLVILRIPLLINHLT